MVCTIAPIFWAVCDNSWICFASWLDLSTCNLIASMVVRTFCTPSWVVRLESSALIAASWQFFAISAVVETISSAAAATVKARLSVARADSEIATEELLISVKFWFNLPSADLIAPTMPCHSTRIDSKDCNNLPNSSFESACAAKVKSPLAILVVTCKAFLIWEVNKLAKKKLTNRDSTTTTIVTKVTATRGTLEFNFWRSSIM